MSDKKEPYYFNVKILRESLCQYHHVDKEGTLKKIDQDLIKQVSEEVYSELVEDTQPDMIDYNICEAIALQSLYMKILRSQIDANYQRILLLNEQINIIIAEDVGFNGHPSSTPKDPKLH